MPKPDLHPAAVRVAENLVFVGSPASIAYEKNRVATVIDAELRPLLEETERAAREDEQRKEIGAGEVLAEIASTLNSLECAHGKHDGGTTPPMMYPEWIRCCVAHAAKRSPHPDEMAAALKAAKTLLDCVSEFHIVFPGEFTTKTGVSMLQSMGELRAELKRINK